jgi:hypothetical protein
MPFAVLNWSGGGARPSGQRSCSASAPQPSGREVRRGQLHAYKLDGRNYYDVRELDAAIGHGGYDGFQRHVNEMAPAPRQRPRARHQEV